MRFSLNIQGNNTDGMPTNGNKSQINEELKMNNANTAIQLNTGTMGTFKSTLRLVGGLALAGIVAMAATFGSVSADSPTKSTSFIAHGPNEMDIEYLSKLTSFIAHGPNEMDIEYLSKLTSFIAHGPNEMDIEYLSKVTYISALGTDYIKDYIKAPKVTAYFNLGPDVVGSSSATAYFNLGPDIVEPNNATTRLP